MRINEILASNCTKCKIKDEIEFGFYLIWAYGLMTSSKY